MIFLTKPFGHNSHSKAVFIYKVVLSTSIATAIAMTTLAPANAAVNQQTPQSQNKPIAQAASMSKDDLAAYKDFQTNADIIRLHHMQYWAETIEAYHAKTGKYPFQGVSKNQLYVFVATPRQQQYVYKIGNEVHKSMQDFIKLLESELGSEVLEYYDPQYVPDAKPNYYVYMIDGDRYYFAIHTHQNYAFSRNVAPNYNKVEVSNIKSANAPAIFLSKALLESKAFNNASDRKVDNLQFFKEREALTLRISKE